jgi:hypothetical protein
MNNPNLLGLLTAPPRIGSGAVLDLAPTMPELGTEELNKILEKTKADLIFMGCPKTEADYRRAIMMAIIVGQIDEANASKMRLDKP